MNTIGTVKTYSLLKEDFKMGHTNSTVNYNLPQFVGTDKPSWLGDVNGAFLAIDTAIAAAKTEADSASGGVAGLQTTVGSHTTQIATLTDTVTAQGGTLNTVTSLIGNGTPTTTDKTLIGAINEINGELVKSTVVTKETEALTVDSNAMGGYSGYITLSDSDLPDNVIAILPLGCYHSSSATRLGIIKAQTAAINQKTWIVNGSIGSAYTCMLLVLYK